MQRIFRHYSRGQSIFQVFLPLRRLMTQSHLGKPLMWIEQGFFFVLVITGLPRQALNSPCSTTSEPGSHSTCTKGDKNRRSTARSVIAPMWGKTHIPGNLPLPACSLLTPARLLSSYLTGCGASLAWSRVMKADQ